MKITSMSLMISDPKRRWQISIRFVLILSACLVVFSWLFASYHPRAEAIKFLRKNGIVVTYQREIPTFFDELLGDYCTDQILSLELAGNFDREWLDGRLTEEILNRISQLHSVKHFSTESLGFNELESYDFLRPLASRLSTLEVGKNFNLNGPMLRSMKSLTELSILKDYDDEVNFSSLAALDQLTVVSVSGGNVRHLDAINNLQSLTLYFSRIDQKEIYRLERLTNLSLINSNIQSFKFLPKLKGLKSLAISNEANLDLTALSELKNLELLSVQDSSISKLPPLKECNKLEVVMFSDTPIQSPQIFRGLMSLRVLEFDFPGNFTFLDLGNLPSLEHIKVQNATVKEISLIGCDNLASICLLDVFLDADAVPNFLLQRPKVQFSFCQGISTVNQQTLIRAAKTKESKSKTKVSGTVD